MDRNILIGIVVAILVVVGIAVAATTNNNPETSGTPPPPTSMNNTNTITEPPSMSEPNPPSETVTPPASATPPPATATPPPVSTPPPPTPTVKTFNVTGSSFEFDPATIRVNKGDTVKIVFKSSAGTHDWMLDEFNAKTSILASGKSETIQFVASKTGTFEYYCSVGNHRQMGMVGKLIVE